jgi:hypothetical protein
VASAPRLQRLQPVDDGFERVSILRATCYMLHAIGGNELHPRVGDLHLVAPTISGRILDCRKKTGFPFQEICFWLLRFRFRGRGFVSFSTPAERGLCIP